MEHLLEILCRAQKVAEQAEVFWVSTQETPVDFEANKLKQIQNKESSSVALRIFRGGRIGFSAASGPDGAGKKGSPSPNLSLEGRGILRDLLDMAVETAQFGSPASFTFPSLKDYPEVSIFDPQVEKMPMEEMIELGNQLIARVRKYVPDILCDVRVTKGTGSVQIVNSQGGEASYAKSFFSLSLEGILIQDTDMLFVADSESSCCLPDKLDVVANRVIRQLELAEENAAVSGVKLLPVIFTPRGVASAFLSPIEVAFNGKAVLEGASPLKDKLGEQVFDNGLSLWDDATIAYGIGSSPCDDEGMPSQCTALIKNGVVSNFLYDLQTAALAGTQSTGNGRRSGGSFPKPAISSLVIDEGGVSFEAMVEDMKEGLIVEQLIGAEQGNLLGGDFGGNVLLGYKVENGKVVGRVKDTMISGNIYQVLARLLGVGSEARWVDGVLRTPALYCSCLSVTASPKPSPSGRGIGRC
ncbi:MAG: TldD/PmbA family protein [Dehalococcoidia bacterium]|nr:TldD/PmbA family protein [Dehalococcoidia bacterium]